MSATLDLVPPLTSPSGKSLLTPEQAAEYLTLSVQTLANWRCKGTGPKFSRRGRVVRYRLVELDRWIEAESAK